MAETPGEAALRKALQRAKIGFKQEAKIGPFRVDFLIGRWLVVEVDGWSHLPNARQEADRMREEELARLGYFVLRIPQTAIVGGKVPESFLEEIRLHMVKKGLKSRPLTEKPFSDSLQVLHGRLKEEEKKDREARRYTMEGWLEENGGDDR